MVHEISVGEDDFPAVQLLQLMSAFLKDSYVPVGQLEHDGVLVNGLKFGWNMKEPGAQHPNLPFVPEDDLK